MQVRPRGGGWLPPVLSGVYRLWSLSWRYRFVGRDVFEDAMADGPVVFAFWHGEQLPVLAPHRNRGIAGLASWSPDGELASRVIQRLGYGVLRGSSSRGAVGAIRSSVAAVGAGQSPALAVDGPRGPRHTIQLGALRIAAQTARPILFVVTRTRTALRLRSWDRFVIPLPGAQIDVAYGRMDPPHPAKDAIEVARERLEEQMGAASQRLISSSSSPLAPPSVD